MSGGDNSNGEIMDFPSRGKDLNETVLDLVDIAQPFIQAFYGNLFRGCLFAFKAEKNGVERLELSKVLGSILRIAGLTGQNPTAMDYSRIKHYTTSKEIGENKRNFMNRIFNLMIYGVDTGKDNNIESTVARLGYDKNDLFQSAKLSVLLKRNALIFFYSFFSQLETIEITGYMHPKRSRSNS
ncbi:unnamed protein product [Adineta steineri]|uniref:Uncharacterized protein n=2 Tax=Adineta steineri TaxID=433720 RepID=A0A813TZL1_9BILA|nr:unnamed protein product [Adineta steineri]CAF0858595.1 unnamed protein product [Adineta steineri]CAF3906782.1 unnamed protein product [Adineta steineri]